MNKKALSEEKSQELQLFSRLLDFTRDGVYRYTFEEGRILFANSGFVRILDLDFPPGQVAGKLLKDLLVYTEEPGTVRQHADAKGEIHDFEYHFKTLKGADRWVWHDSFISTDPKTGQKVVEAYVRDITEHKRSESALRDSEERLRFARESSGIGAWDLDLVDHTAFRSIEHDRIFGFPKLLPRWTYEMFLEHVLPEDRVAVDEKFRRAIATQSNWNFECRIRRADGQVRWILAAGRHQFNAAGAARRMAGIVQDITERKQTDQALKDSLRLLNSTGEMARVGGWELDLATSELFWTEEVCRIHGVEPGYKPKLEEALDFYSLESRPAIAAAVKRGMETGEPWDLELLFSPRGGKARIWVRAQGRAIVSNGKIVKLAGAFQDITERKLAEEQVRKLNAELEERVAQRTAQLEMAVEELEAFSYSVSHDLQAPLRAMDGFSQALLEDYADQLDAQGRDYLSRVRGGAQRMAKMIDGFLKLSRAGRAEMQLKPLDLGALAREAAAELRRSDPGRKVEFSAAGDLRAVGDAALLRIVLDNLLGNAWKFTAKAARAKVEFGAAPGAAGAAGQKVFRVRDNGAGFDQARVGKLFRAFQRLHGSAEFPGSGIGLATVRRIIHRHGGRVWAEGAVGKGAAFYFTLPARPVREAP
ncbi:MAG: PAS domain S-box protein [Elusimicrobia bacterium]|nr:PAS domain S-box protein [Elusimicrobiota bacterium]